MTDEERAGGRGLGPTGEAVRRNIQRIRGRMPVTELSARLDNLGRPIPPLGVRRIESGERRVDVDDLLAFSVALGVSPVTLLMPDSGWTGEVHDARRPDGTRQRDVEVTGLQATNDAVYIWDWIRAEQPLPGMSDVEFISRAWPAWLQHRQRILVGELLEKEQARTGLSSDNSDIPHGND